MISKVLLFVIAAVSANPCNKLGYNSTPQQDYEAIVLHGCDPFEVLRNRRLGAPRAQQDLIPDLGDGLDGMLAMNALSGGGLLGGTTTAAGSSTGGLDTTTMMLLGGDSEDLVAASLLGGGAGLGNLANLALADEMTLTKPRVNAIRRDQIHEAQEEMNLRKVIHALTSGPTVTQEQLSTAAQLGQELNNRKAAHAMKRHQLRRPRVEQTENTADTAQDLIPDLGDYGDMLALQMLMGGGSTGATTSPNLVSALLGGGGSTNSLMALATADAVGDILDSRRLRSPRAPAKTNTANTAQMDDDIAMMMMMNAANGGSTNAAGLIGLTDIDDMGEAMAFAQMANGGSSSTATTSGTTTPASSSSGLATMALLDADMDDASALMMSGALSGQTSNLAAAALIDRRLASPRRTSRLVPVYRKLQ